MNEEMAGGIGGIDEEPVMAIGESMADEAGP
jgi:hypothetical protein